ncbi:hypothetical protein PT300_10275 [Enterobacteriaceae bacterium ESL0689]|nr:hypothetical protein [Enterobacteriaceae bacterium ESL0689]
MPACQYQQVALAIIDHQTRLVPMIFAPERYDDALLYNFNYQLLILKE